jgi:ribonuclease BN (tRNA processing enzyme)
VKIKFLGIHNAESKYTRLSTFLIDDVLAVDTGSLTSELSFSEQEKIKAIILSHGHYDHIRDIPAFAFNNACHTTRVYATKQTLKILSSHLIDGIIYPKFTIKTPICEKQSLELVSIEPYIPFDIEGYKILPIPVKHNNIDAVGFEITSKDGKKIFYSGDTGQGLSHVWNHVTPDLMIMDLTFPNKLIDTAKNSAHLCPSMLKNELRAFNRIKGYYPKVILTHLTPKFQEEIKKEVKKIAEELDISIEIASIEKKLIV